MSGFSHPFEDLVILAFAIYPGQRRGVAYDMPVKLDAL
jgi:hypothetical protein